MKDSLVISDLHLTTKPLDEYKWSVFEWILNILEHEQIDTITILGDLTEKKDNHPALLVNKLCSYLEVLLCAGVKTIRILKGNHDFLDAETPFFEFLNVSPNIQFIPYPIRLGTDFFYPYSLEYDIEKYSSEINKCNVLYMHTQLAGTKLFNGKVLEEGMTSNDFKSLKHLKRVLSGHIHYNTQDTLIGKDIPFHYVGSPYPVYFGDASKYGSGLVIRHDGSVKSEYFLSSPARYNESFLNIGEFRQWAAMATQKNDQMKISFELEKWDYDKWPDIKKEVKAICKKQQLELVSLTLKPKKNTTLIGDEAWEVEVSSLSYDEVLKRFAEKERVSAEYLAVAKEIISENS